MTITDEELRVALRERLELGIIAPPQVGSLVFAQSTDGKYYVAEVESVVNEDVRVRYLRGSQHTVTIQQLRPAAFLPGERVIVNWPWWGPWTCDVISYDAERETIKVSDGMGTTKAFPISEVWQTDRTAWSGKLRIAVTWLAIGTALGAVAGASLMRLFP